MFSLADFQDGQREMKRLWGHRLSWRIPREKPSHKIYLWVKRRCQNMRPDTSNFHLENIRKLSIIKRISFHMGHDPQGPSPFQSVVAGAAAGGVESLVTVSTLQYFPAGPRPNNPRVSHRVHQDSKTAPKYARLNNTPPRHSSQGVRPRYTIYWGQCLLRLECSQVWRAFPHL